MPPAAVAVQKVSTSNVPAVYEYVGQTAGSRDVARRARERAVLDGETDVELAQLRRALGEAGPGVA